MRTLAKTCLAAVVTVLFASPAAAKTICVKPTGGTTTGNPCFNLISNALIHGSPATGDIVSVAAGVYKEPSNIYIGTNGLHVVGPTTAIVDNEIGTGAANWVFDVAATDVVIQGLTIRNGQTLGIHVATGADRFTLSATTINGIDDTCLQINANDAVVKSSKFYNCGNDAIDFYGKNLSVTGSTFRNLGCDALYAEADTADSFDLGSVVFSHNTVSQTSCSGVYITGNYNGATPSPGAASGTFQSNLMTNVDSYGIYFANNTSNDPGTAIVTGNKITNSYYSGIYLDHMNATSVTANSVKNAYDDYAIVVYGGGAHNVSSNTINTTYYSGIYVDSSITGNYPDGTVIKLNHVNPEPDSAGIYAYNGANMTISSNVITNALYGIYTETTDQVTVLANVITTTIDTGIRLDCHAQTGTPPPCTGATVKLNKVTNAANGYGISFAGDGGAAGTKVIESNIVKNATNPGVYVNADNVTLSKNQVFYSGTDGDAGFLVHGNNPILIANVSRYSGGDGFFVDGTGATLTGNSTDHNADDGFDIHGTSATLNTNHSTFNNGSGFEVAAGLTGPTGLGNTAAGNGVDYCDASSSAMTVTAPTAKQTPADCSIVNGFIGD